MAAATSSAHGGIKRARENAGNIFPPRVPMSRGVYQDQARMGPIQRAMQGMLNDDGPGPSPRVVQRLPEEARGEVQNGAKAEEEQVDGAEKEDEEEEEEDVNLMQKMGKSTITPCHQLDILLRYLKIGFFLSTVEVLMDNASESEQTIRKEAEKKWLELLESTGDGEVPKTGPALCGSAKIARDMKLMAKHTDYIAELLVKFYTDFDGSTAKLNKIQKATGFIRGLMVFDTNRKVTLYNNLSKPIPGNFDQDLDIFKNNAVIFIEYLRTYQETQTPYPKCLALLLPNE